jgi:hypothetical protein
MTTRTPHDIESLAYAVRDAARTATAIITHDDPEAAAAIARDGLSATVAAPISTAIDTTIAASADIAGGHQTVWLRIQGEIAAMARARAVDRGYRHRGRIARMVAAGMGTGS